MLLPVLLVVGSYFLGAIPFGYLVARWRGVDILREGSRNIGATNVGRVLGRRFGILVFLLDFAKGAVPVLAARLWDNGEQDQAHVVPVAAGVAAFLGHLFPIYLRLRGGKGVATAAGAVAVLLPGPFFAAFLAWGTVFVSSRIMSLASITAAVVLCLMRLLFTTSPWSSSEVVLTSFCLIAATLVIVRHHANVRRLLSGKENRFAESPLMTHLCKGLHLFALALWFGSMVFFTITGAILFPTFDRIAAKAADDPGRPRWLPVPKDYDRPPPAPAFPDPLRREQGSRIAGEAVSPLFPWYYGIQVGCAGVALMTAVSLSQLGRHGRAHRLRVLVLVLAAAGVGIGCWLDSVVSELRGPRNALTDQVLQKDAPTSEEMTQAAQARANFGRWHGYSLIDNFATLLLVTVAVALAAALPVPAQAAHASLNGHLGGGAKAHATSEPPGG
jgi:acyl-phosphate glycerol 3-phosphate acyltransferase